MLVNLTEHTLNIHFDIDAAVSKCLNLPPSGEIARVKTSSVKVDEVQHGNDIIPVFATSFGEVENLPDPQEGVTYVASLVVAKKAVAEGRRDVVSPGRLIRDDEGQPCGCWSLNSPS